MSEQIQVNETSTVARPDWVLRVGVKVSLVLHFAAFGTVLVLPFLWLLDPPSFDDTAITVVHSAKVEEDDTESPEVRIVTEPEEVKANMVEDRLNKVIAEANKLSDEEKQDRLNELAKRLEGVSSEESVDQIATKFNEWFGNQRATKPAEEPVAGDFDHDTAQMHDARREEGKLGGWVYYIQLIDAEGRLTEVELDGPEGETLYTTMQRIKSFPLMEKVYRQIAMPILDRLMKSANQTDASPNKSPPDQTESPADPAATINST